MTDPLQRQEGGDHYKGFAISPAEFLQKNRVPFCEANAIKYLMRHRSKGGKSDLLKAIHYIEILIELEYPKPAPAESAQSSPEPSLRA